MPAVTLPKFLVTWDIPKDLASSQTRLYREIDRLIGDGNCDRIANSVYLVSGEHAIQRAYTLAQLAAEFGAGAVGEEGGPQVHQIVEVEPGAHFESLSLARKIVDQLRVDHRRKGSRRKTRDFNAIVSELIVEREPTIGYDERTDSAFIILPSRSARPNQPAYARAGT